MCACSHLLRRAPSSQTDLLLPRADTLRLSMPLSGLLWIDWLVSKRGSGKQLMYRVRWQGYSPSEDTWEPAQHLRSELGRTTTRAW